MRKVVIFILIIGMLIPLISQSFASGSDFSDVKTSDWFYADVSDLVSRGTIQGYPDGTFRPDGMVTKAEFTKMLVMALGWDVSKATSDSFTDTKNHWARDYIETAVKNKVLNAGGKLNPDAAIIRKDVALMIAKTYEWYQSDLRRIIESPYVDYADQSAFQNADGKVKPTEYAGVVENLFGRGIMRGSIVNGKRYFYPSASIKRSEVSATLVRTIKHKENPNTFVKSIIDELASKGKFEKAPVDREFENFMASPEAKNYCDSGQMLVKDGVFYLKCWELTHHYSDAEYYAFDYEYNPHANRILYQMLKDMVNMAKQNDLYVGLFSNSYYLKLGIFEYKGFNVYRLSEGDISFATVLIPYKGNDFDKPLKYNQYYYWNPYRFFTYKDIISGRLKNNLQLMPEFDSLYRKMLSNVYGQQTGQKIYDYSMSNYMKEMASERPDLCINTSVQYFDGIEIANCSFKDTGALCDFYTSNIN